MERIISIDYNPMLFTFGLPRRLTSNSNFNLSENVVSYSVNLGGDYEKIVTPAKQLKQYDTAMTDASGWLMYVCANGIVNKAKLVAASIMQEYLERGMKSVWLTSFDHLKNQRFSDLHLVVIDTLFFDSSPYRRDKIYEIINHNCNVADLSVLVIGQNTDPLAMANQLAMKPDLAILTK